MKVVIRGLCSIVVLFIIFVQCAFGQKLNWFDKVESIKIGSSTKSDVERLFSVNKADRINSFVDNGIAYYTTSEGSLSVSFSLGKCISTGGYDLAEGAVLDVYFRGLVPLNKSKVKRDLSNYERTKEDDTPNWNYSNVDEGILLVFYDDRRLSSVSFGLSKAQRERLSCAALK